MSSPAGSQGLANVTASDVSSTGDLGSNVQAALDATATGLDGKQTTLPVGTSGALLVSNGSAYLAQAPSTLFTNVNVPQLVDCQSNPQATGWTPVLGVTGQIGSVSGTTSTNPGQWFGRVGSTTGSRAGWQLGPATGGLLVPSSSTVGFVEFMMQFENPSAGPNTYDFFAGFIADAGNASTTNGVYFYVDTAGNLRARRNVGGVVNPAEDVLVEAAQINTWYRLRTTFNAGNVVLSWARTTDRLAALTTALTVPIVAAAQSPCIKIVRQAGTGSRGFLVDYLSHYLPKT